MYEYELTDIRVVDGDTVEGDVQLGLGVTMRRKIRLLEVDVWETRGKNKVKGEAGKQDLISIIHHLGDKEKVVVMTQKDKKGKYGRLLGWLFVQGEDTLFNINQHMKKYHSKKKED